MEDGPIRPVAPGAVALVTGAGSDIGRALAATLALRGVAVARIGAAPFEVAHPAVLPIVADVRDPVAVTAAFDRIREPSAHRRSSSTGPRSTRTATSWWKRRKASWTRCRSTLAAPSTAAMRSCRRWWPQVAAGSSTSSPSPTSCPPRLPPDIRCQRARSAS